MNREQQLEAALKEIIRWAKSTRIAYNRYYPPQKYEWEQGYTEGLEYAAEIAEKALKGENDVELP